MMVYKALYKKMMDCLKDADMWVNWAIQLKDKNPEAAEYLCESAKDRIENDFPKSYDHFKAACETGKDEHSCMSEMVEDSILEWRDSILSKTKKW